MFKDSQEPSGRALHALDDLDRSLNFYDGESRDFTEIVEKNGADFNLPLKLLQPPG